MNKEVLNSVNDLIKKNNYIKVNDQVYLKKYQKDILDLYHIPYNSCGSISEILYLIDEVDDGEEELDNVARELQEFNYYHNTNK